MPLPSFKDIASAIQVLKGVDQSVVDAVAQDLRLEAAAKAEAATGREAPYVADHWTEGHLNRTATKEQIKFGPREASSGEGAERMIRDYSNPAPQHGITLTAEKLSEFFGPINSSMKSQTALLLVVAKSIEAVAESIKNGAVKADLAQPAAAPAVTAKSEDEEEDDEEESEVVEINASRAKSFLAKARQLIADAKVKKAEASEQEEMGEEEKCKALKVEAFKLRKAAAKLLGKARNAAYAAKASDIIVDIRKAATKADINVVQEEEEEEEDEEESGKSLTAAAAPAPAATPATKAKENDAGNQADRQDPSNGNQVDAAAKAEATQQVEKALAGIGMLQSDVKTIMTTIMNASRNSPIVPSFVAKATPELTESLTEKLLNMEDAGEMVPADVNTAREILSRVSAVKAGVLDPKIVTDRIAKSSSTVRSFFESALAA